VPWRIIAGSAIILGVIIVAVFVAVWPSGPPVTPQPDASAMYSAGEIFYNAGDYAMARGWYEKAAAQGDTNAMTAFGKRYQDGRGVPRGTTLRRASGTRRRATPRH